MKTLACLSLLALSSFSLGAIGCSGSESSDPFGAEPDYATLKQRISSPTGTLDARNMGGLFARYSEQRGTSSIGSIGISSPKTASADEESAATTSSSGTHSQALRILGGGSSLTSSCGAIAQGTTTGSCSCPEGGSFTYDFSGLTTVQQSTGPIDASIKVRFDSCRMKDLGLDGREFVRLHADRGGAKVDMKSLELLLVADLTVSKGAETHTLDLAALVRNGQFELAVSVDDGWVTVSSTSSGAGGSFVVRDRNSTWTCNVVNGAGSCKDDKGNTHAF